MNFGDSEVTEFATVLMEPSGPSSWRDNLIEKPNGRYKFGSIEINASRDKVIQKRSIFNLRDLLGNVGGFAKAMKVIFEVIMWPFVSFNFASVHLTAIFRHKSVDEPG